MDERADFAIYTTSLQAKLIKQAIGKYLVDGEEIAESVDLFGGKLILEHLYLDPQALTDVDIDFEVIFGCIDHLNVSIPLGNFESGSISCCLSGVYLLLRHRKFDFSRRPASSEAKPNTELHKDKPKIKASQQNGWFGGVSYLKTRVVSWATKSILRNLIQQCQVKLENVHFCFEDPKRGYSLGCSLKLCYLQYGDMLAGEAADDGDSSSGSSNGHFSITKLLAVSHLTLYSGPHLEPASLSAAAVEKNAKEQSIQYLSLLKSATFETNYLLLPTNIDIYIKLLFNSESIFTGATINVIIPALLTSLRDSQASNIITFMSTLGEERRLRKMHSLRERLRPARPVEAGNTGMWWRYITYAASGSYFDPSSFASKYHQHRRDREVYRQLLRLRTLCGYYDNDEVLSPQGGAPDALFRERSLYNDIYNNSASSVSIMEIVSLIHDMESSLFAEEISLFQSSLSSEFSSGLPKSSSSTKRWGNSIMEWLTVSTDDQEETLDEDERDKVAGEKLVDIYAKSAENVSEISISLSVFIQRVEASLCLESNAATDSAMAKLSALYEQPQLIGLIRGRQLCPHPFLQFVLRELRSDVEIQAASLSVKSSSSIADIDILASKIRSSRALEPLFRRRNHIALLSGWEEKDAAYKTPSPILSVNFSLDNDSAASMSTLVMLEPFEIMLFSNCTWQHDLLQFVQAFNGQSRADFSEPLSSRKPQGHIADELEVSLGLSAQDVCKAVNALNLTASLTVGASVVVVHVESPQATRSFAIEIGRIESRMDRNRLTRSSNVQTTLPRPLSVNLLDSVLQELEQSGSSPALAFSSSSRLPQQELSLAIAYVEISESTSTSSNYASLFRSQRRLRNAKSLFTHIDSVESTIVRIQGVNMSALLAGDESDALRSFPCSVSAHVVEVGVKITSRLLQFLADNITTASAATAASSSSARVGDALDDVLDSFQDAPTGVALLHSGDSKNSFSDIWRDRASVTESDDEDEFFDALDPATTTESCFSRRRPEAEIELEALTLFADFCESMRNKRRSRSVRRKSGISSNRLRNSIAQLQKLTRLHFGISTALVDLSGPFYLLRSNGGSAQSTRIDEDFDEGTILQFFVEDIVAEVCITKGDSSCRLRISSASLDSFNRESHTVPVKASFFDNTTKLRILSAEPPDPAASLFSDNSSSFVIASFHSRSVQGLDSNRANLLSLVLGDVSAQSNVRSVMSIVRYFEFVFAMFKMTMTESLVGSASLPRVEESKYAEEQSPEDSQQQIGEEEEGISSASFLCHFPRLLKLVRAALEVKVTLSKVQGTLLDSKFAPIMSLSVHQLIVKTPDLLIASVDVGNVIFSIFGRDSRLRAVLEFSSTVSSTRISLFAEEQFIRVRVGIGKIDVRDERIRTENFFGPIEMITSESSPADAFGTPNSTAISATIDVITSESASSRVNFSVRLPRLSLCVISSAIARLVVLLDFITQEISDERGAICSKCLQALAWPRVNDVVISSCDCICKELSPESAARCVSVKAQFARPIADPNASHEIFPPLRVDERPILILQRSLKWPAGFHEVSGNLIVESITATLMCDASAHAAHLVVSVASVTLTTSSKGLSQENCNFSISQRALLLESQLICGALAVKWVCSTHQGARRQDDVTQAAARVEPVEEEALSVLQPVRIAAQLHTFFIIDDENELKQSLAWIKMCDRVDAESLSYRINSVVEIRSESIDVVVDVRVVAIVEEILKSLDPLLALCFADFKRSDGIKAAPCRNREAVILTSMLELLPSIFSIGSLELTLAIEGAIGGTLIVGDASSGRRSFFRVSLSTIAAGVVMPVIRKLPAAAESLHDSSVPSHYIVPAVAASSIKVYSEGELKGDFYNHNLMIWEVLIEPVKVNSSIVIRSETPDQGPPILWRLGKCVDKSTLSLQGLAWQAPVDATSTDASQISVNVNVSGALNINVSISLIDAIGAVIRAFAEVDTSGHAVPSSTSGDTRATATSLGTCILNQTGSDIRYRSGNQSKFVILPSGSRMPLLASSQSPNDELSLRQGSSSTCYHPLDASISEGRRVELSIPGFESKLFSIPIDGAAHNLGYNKSFRILLRKRGGEHEEGGEEGNEKTYSISIADSAVVELSSERGEKQLLMRSTLMITNETAFTFLIRIIPPSDEAAEVVWEEAVEPGMSCYVPCSICSIEGARIRLLQMLSESSRVGPPSMTAYVADIPVPPILAVHTATSSSSRGELRVPTLDDHSNSLKRCYKAQTDSFNYAHWLSFFADRDRRQADNLQGAATHHHAIVHVKSSSAEVGGVKYAQNAPRPLLRVVRIAPPVCVFNTLATTIECEFELLENKSKGGTISSLVPWKASSYSSSSKKCDRCVIPSGESASIASFGATDTISFSLRMANERNVATHRDNSDFSDWSRCISFPSASEMSSRFTATTEIIWCNGSALRISIDIGYTDGARAVYVYVPYWIVPSSRVLLYFRHDSDNEAVSVADWLNGSDGICADQQKSMDFAESGVNVLTEACNGAMIPDLLGLLEPGPGRDDELTLSRLKKPAPQPTAAADAQRLNSIVEQSRYCNIIHLHYSNSATLRTCVSLQSARSDSRYGWSDVVPLHDITPLAGFNVDVKSSADAETGNDTPFYYPMAVVEGNLRDPRFSRTRVLFVLDAVVLKNALSVELEVRQCCSEATAAAAARLTVAAGRDEPIRWLRGKRKVQIRVKENDWGWSGSLSFGRDEEVQLPLRNRRTGAVMHIVVLVAKRSSRVLVEFTANERFLPYRVGNKTDEVIRIRQALTSSESWLVLPPYHECDYIWDEPYGKKVLQVQILKREFTAGDWIDAGDFSFRQVVELEINRLAVSTVCSRIFPSIGVSGSADGAIYCLTMSYLQTEQKPLALPQETIQSQFKLSVRVENLGVAVIDELPRELLFLSIDNVKFTHEVAKVSPKTKKANILTAFRISAEHLQLDDLTHDTHFPCILYSKPRLNAERQHCLLLEFNQLDSDLAGLSHVSKLLVDIAPLGIQTDMTLVATALDFLLLVLKLLSLDYPQEKDRKASTALDLVDKDRKVLASMPVVQRRYHMMFDSFCVSDIELTLSFDPSYEAGAPGALSLGPNFGPIAASLAALAKIDHCHFIIQSLSAKNILLTSEALNSLLVSHYVAEAAKKLHVLIGSFDIIGSPSQAIENLRNELISLAHKLFSGGLSQWVFSPFQSISNAAMGSFSLSRLAVGSVLDASHRSMQALLAASSARHGRGQGRSSSRSLAAGAGELSLLRPISGMLGLLSFVLGSASDAVLPAGTRAASRFELFAAPRRTAHLFKAPQLRRQAHRRGDEDGVRKALLQLANRSEDPSAAVLFQCYLSHHQGSMLIISRSHLMLLKDAFDFSEMLWAISLSDLLIVDIDYPQPYRRHRLWDEPFAAGLVRDTIPLPPTSRPTVTIAPSRSFVDSIQIRLYCAPSAASPANTIHHVSMGPSSRGHLSPSDSMRLRCKVIAFDSRKQASDALRSLLAVAPMLRTDALDAYTRSTPPNDEMWTFAERTTTIQSEEGT